MSSPTHNKPQEEEDLPLQEEEEEEEDLLNTQVPHPETEDLDLEDEELDHVEEDLDSDSDSSNGEESESEDTSHDAATLNLTLTAVPITSTLTIGTNIDTTVAALVTPDPKRQRVMESTTLVATPAIVVQKPSAAFDESRRLFQRLWTDEDEIGLLQGFLEYTRLKTSGTSSTSHHIDTAPFYDQIRGKLQLDFNKNQLVDKLRRLKKKYRNFVNRVSNGKDFSFKSPHDQATFEICQKIWTADGSLIGGGGVDDVVMSAGSEGLDIEQKFHSNNGGTAMAAMVGMTVNDVKSGGGGVNVGMVTPRPRIRTRKMEENNANASFTSAVEETVRSCLSPLIKELVNCGNGGAAAGGGSGLGGMGLSPFPLNVARGELVDDKWRKQQILELEVYSKRVELVQDQIKLKLEELRTPGAAEMDSS